MIHLEVAIDSLAITCLDHTNDEFGVFDRVQDPISALPNAVTLKTGKLCCASWPGILGERLDSFYDTAAIGFRGNLFEFFSG